MAVIINKATSLVTSSSKGMNGKTLVDFRQGIESGNLCVFFLQELVCWVVIYVVVPAAAGQDETNSAPTASLLLKSAIVYLSVYPQAVIPILALATLVLMTFPLVVGLFCPERTANFWFGVSVATLIQQISSLGFGSAFYLYGPNFNEIDSITVLPSPAFWEAIQLYIWAGFLLVILMQIFSRLYSVLFDAGEEEEENVLVDVDGSTS
mmetsp:Transcript_2348/g.3193  ORF Transcript_2348/g.3193 Transcript_2348/m.3193 type:complete len:208 (+) Transcript_2348:205-828(+)|eukprot:CAMPEP_0198145828 /NCGR_PEP_ID=MMETSP1443-20131203/25570_1 /TAXON_ID=186043 /ORGANISM="Entomoneis sp., Strain CCMP2396" /LENGTH=207 /DNA_ID=CAMNT_0043809565 /DNA_START=171 /DNA_END=794 /DNA_ORIENTATION=+